MADSKYPPTQWLATLPVAIIAVPVVPGLIVALKPAFTEGGWAAFAASSDTWAGVRLMLWTASASTLLALALAMLMFGALLANGRGQWVIGVLPAWLAMPHVAFGVGFAMLAAPSGLLVRLFAAPLGWQAPPSFAFPQDDWGLGLIVALAIKESAFLLWLLIGMAKTGPFTRRMVTARSLGYGPAQSFMAVIMPDILSKLAWPMAAVFSYGLSVVDLALVLGPGNPPTFAVSVWRWLSDPDPAIAARGSAGAIFLMLVLGLVLAAVWLASRLAGSGRHLPMGQRHGAGLSIGTGVQWGVGLLFALAIAVLALWSFSAGWFFPAILPSGFSLSAWQRAGLSPFVTTLALAVMSGLLAVLMAFLWLEFGPKNRSALLMVPLVLPVLPLAIGQYRALLALEMDGTFTGMVWSHLFWVLPYVALSLAGPHAGLDPRHRVIAASLGHGRLATAFRVTTPMLALPILFAFSVGFSVSVAQYLPTLYAGSGRFATVTTEAVALSSGGNRQVLAVQSLLQALLPLAAFAASALIGRVIAANRRGLA